MMSYEEYNEGRHKSKGGLIRSFVKIKRDKIENIEFSGDFFLFPESAIEQITESLNGINIDFDSVLAAIQSVYKSEDVTAPGTTPQDFATSIMKAIDA